MTKDKSTEEKILHAAREVFTVKGMSGARMQEIADKAGINKALLHYYFRNKEKLFQAIFKEAFEAVAPKINQILDADLSLEEKIRKFVDQYITTIDKNPFLPAFVLHELNTNPEGFAAEILKNNKKPNPEKLLNQIADEVARGNIRPIHPAQLLLNIIGLCIFPYIGKPMFMGVTGIPEPVYWNLLEQRKTEVAEFILKAIRP